MLGVLLQDVGNSFSAGLLRALEDECRKRQIALLVASLDEEPERERLLVADLVSRRVDGLVIMPATDRHEYLEAAVIRQDVKRIGQEAARMVLGRLDGADNPPVHATVPHTLVTRGSGEIPLTPP